MEQFLTPSYQVNPLSEKQSELLISSIQNHGEELVLSRREYVNVNSEYIYFLIDGHLIVSLAKDKFAIDYAFRYMPIGMAELTNPEINISYRALSSVRLLKIHVNILDDLYESGNGEIFRILMILKTSILSALLRAYEERCTRSAYETIQLLLVRYLSEPEHLEGLASFILRRTHFSRGYVFSVLAKLRNRGVLHMQNGRLIAINSEFPEQL